MSKKPIKKLADLAKEALDMSKEARMARAEKMGFDTATTYYHGTRGDISQFAKEAMGETTGAQSARKGFFFASEPDTAAQYAEISSSRPALRGATGVEDKFYAEGPAALEYKRYMAERDLKHLQDSNRHMEKYLSEMPKNRQYWLDSIEKSKGPPEIGVRSDGSTYEKYRTPEETGLANLAKMEARAAEYKKALSKAGQKKLNAEIADQQAKLDEITNYIQDSQGGQNVVPVHLKLKNPLVHDFKGEHYREVSYNELMQKAKDEGHDGVIFKNTFDPGHKWGPDEENPQDIVAVFKPEQIRSVNAKFDPKKKGSGNILDSLGPIAVGAGAATLAASNDALAADLNSPVASGMGEVASQAGHAMERFDAYTANPFRKFLNSALEGKGIIQSAREGVQAFGAEKPTTGEEVAKNFLSLSPNQNLGFPTADGGKDYPLAGPLGVAVDFAVDPTNIPMAKAVGPGMDAASSISRIIEQSLLKRGLVLP